MHHFTVQGPGEALLPNTHLNLEPGRVRLQIKAWTTDENAAVDMFVAVCNDIKFKLDGDVEVFHTEAIREAKDVPFAYDVGWDPL